MLSMHHAYRFFANRFRPARMRAFESAFALHPHLRVLDVGGTPYNWQFVTVQPQLTLLNLSSMHDRSIPQVRANGCALPYRDQAFEVVFSNSVIEHLGSFTSQRNFAAEIRRVGRGYWVQTPNFWFPVEPHFLTPAFHWLPRRWRHRLVRHFTPLGWFASRPEGLHAMIEEIALLSRRQMRALFPDASILVERVMGLPKSLIAVKRSW